MIDTIKNSSDDQATNLTKEILNIQSFYLKIINNKKKTLI